MARLSANISNTTAVLGRGAHVKGRISGDGDLRVDGAVEGDVALRGALTVSEGATITADVQATSVVVEGAVEGDIAASETVSIRSSAQVTGDIRGATISIEEGASVSGRIDADFDLPAELGGKGGR
jgi:cytoskeletal protein CcmA (bactofilin family)